MSYYLCLETSTEVCSVAIGNKNSVLTSSDISRRNSHSETITLQIEECLKEAGITYGELTAVGIGKGPGSYTGLRVGTSVAKGICYAWKIPLIGIDTLYGIAYGSVNNADPGTLIMPMVDARRMEVYTALYDVDLNEKRKVFNLILKEGILSEVNADQLLLCGNGAFKAEGLDLGVETIIFPTSCSASFLMRRCNELFNKRCFEDVAYFSPFYFKSPNITKSKKNIL